MDINDIKETIENHNILMRRAEIIDINEVIKVDLLC